MLIAICLVFLRGVECIYQQHSSDAAVVVDKSSHFFPLSLAPPTSSVCWLFHVGSPLEMSQ